MVTNSVFCSEKKSNFGRRKRFFFKRSTKTSEGEFESATVIIRSSSSVHLDDVDADLI